MLNRAKQDGSRVKVMAFQDPAAAGKGEAERFIKMMAGFDCGTTLASGSKETNARSFSAQVEHGNVKIWAGIPKREKDLFYSQLESFPDANVHDDFVDAGSGAFNELTVDNSFGIF
jgi:predicted phage terminase large subunit-like protein